MRRKGHKFCREYDSIHSQFVLQQSCTEQIQRHGDSLHFLVQGEIQEEGKKKNQARSEQITRDCNCDFEILIIYLLI